MLDEVLLYELTDSPFCIKARICLNWKRVPFRRVPVTIGRLGELRRLNPLRKVPVLVDGDAVVADSSAIVQHLESRHPEPGLLPKDADARAYCLLVEDWADEALYFLGGAFKWLDPRNRAAAVANTIPELASGVLRPFVAWGVARSVRRRYAAWGYKADAIGHLEDRMRGNLDVLAALLGDRLYLLGRTPTLADVAVFAQLAWMRRYVQRRLLDDVPAVARWIERFAAEPAVAAALPA
jgi:glutathione S-transferase